MMTEIERDLSDSVFLLPSGIGRIMAPQRCLYPISGNCGHVTLRGKRDFATMIKDLKQRDYPGLCRRTQWNREDPYK